jgi:tellurite resistance protein
MDLLEPDPQSAPDQLRAIAMVARAAGKGLDSPQRALLDAIQRVVMETDLDLESLLPISPGALAKRVGDSAQARQLIRLMVVMALSDGPPSKEQMSILSSFASAMGVEEPAVEVIGHLAKGRLLRFRLAFMRRSHVRHYLKNTYRMSGSILAVIRSLLIFRGVIQGDPETASRFRAMENLPEDSLGHRFFHHCADADLPFPGEKGGFPEGALYHDFTHVLTGYDTSPEGEMKNAAFQAGYTQDDHDFFVWLFSIVLHTTGINLLPFPIEVLPGRIGQDDLAVDILRELKRGTRMKLDLGDGWSCWDYVELPIEVARERLGVPPLDSIAAARLSRTA